MYDFNEVKYMKLGDIIKEFLEQNDMTQKDLAQALDITPAALGNYVRNIREPDYNTLLKIADFFHVSTDTLLGHDLDSKLTRDEEILLAIYRSLNSEQKEFYLEQGKIFIKQNKRH